MFRKTGFYTPILVLLLCLIFTRPLFAESAFDFGLPLFGHEEVRFEKTKPADFNFQLLKKYISEHENSALHQLHAISRWFSLIKLSDTPRKSELINLSKKFFSTADKKDPTVLERVREIFFEGLLLSQEKRNQTTNEDDEKFEDLLLEAESKIADSPDYSIVKGIIFHLLKDRPNGYFARMKPEEDLKKALSLIPRTAHYYFVMGQAFRFLGTMDSSLFLSIASYEKCSSLDPRNGKLQNALLGIYMGLHEEFQSKGKPEPFWLEEAVYKKILMLSPTNPYALNNLGYLYAEYGVNTRLAQELCQKAVNLSPDNPGFRDSLGWAAFKNKDYQTAEAELKRSLSMRNNVYEPNYHIATLYYATGKLDKAEEYYRAAIKLKPDSAEALNNLAYLLAEQNKKIDEAMIMAENAVKLEPNNASYLDTLGWLYYRANDFDKALDLLLKSAHLAPGQGEILMHIGMVYLEKGEFSTAVDYLKQAWKADPTLNATEGALYLALRLKSYYTSLIEYHEIMGAKANRDRICNILMAISRLYQEEKLYEKAIEITRIAADVKNGTIKLSEPIFGFYKLPDIAANDSASETDTALDQDVENDKSENPLPDEVGDNSENMELSGDNAEHNTATQDESLEKIPENAGFPIVISIGPDFFRRASKYVAGFEQLENHSLTLFIANFLRPSEGLILRLEAENTPGTTLLQLTSDYFSQINADIKESGNTDSMSIGFGNKLFYAAASGNSVYLSTKAALPLNFLEIMNNILPHNSDGLISIFYDWREFQNQLPELIKPFIRNPMRPFTTLVSRYTYDDKVLSEFSILTTGKTENTSFMKHFARELFAFKLYCKSMGIDATLKIRQEGDLIYLLSDLEGIEKTLDNRLPKFFQELVFNYLKSYFSGYSCFISRMLYSSDLKNICPQHGEISADGPAGIVACSIHHNTPAIPFFVDESAACRFYRKRLEKIIKDNPKLQEKAKGKEYLLKDLAKEYNVPQCPTSGSWKLDEDGTISCTDHEK
ncbi:MAG: hypothetical protein Kow0029_25990 [Candidatus Rifleibacteriota bacterium]